MKSIIFSFGLLLFAVTFASGADTVTGENVTFIKYGDSKTAFLGTFIQRGGDLQWEEEKQKQGVAVNTFRETHRDAWSVYLVDDSRDVKIQLDLHTKKVMYSDPKWPTPNAIYNITERYAGSNGWTVCSAQIRNQEGYLGGFIQTSSKGWIEIGKDGKTRWNFEEQGRDEWSVYLQDKSRDMNIQLDLYTKKVMLNTKDRRPLYEISKTFVGPNGWTVKAVKFGHAKERGMLGSFVQTGEKTWVEQGKSGKSRYKFNENARDEWSVYLHDASREVNIQLDLYTGKVMYSEGKNPRKELYVIKTSK